MTRTTVVAFVAYFISMLIVGLWCYMKTRSQSDYILGGRNLSPGVAALSAGASDLSSWALMGLPGAVVSKGLGVAWIAVFTIIGAYLNWKCIAPRLRVYTELANDSQTIPEFLHNRFQDNTNILRIFSSVVILFFFIFYVAAGLSAGAVLFQNTFHMSYYLALWVGGFVIVAYTFLGGYLAVCWTDFFQGILMAASLFVVFAFLNQVMGGPAEAWHATVGEMSRENYAVKFVPDLDLGWGLGLLSCAGWCLGYFGQPHVLVRFMGVRSVKDIAISRYIAVSWATVTMVSALGVGVLGKAYLEQHGLTLDNPETIFMYLSRLLLNPWVAGVVIAGVLAAIMSTIDSQLLVCSSILSEDFYRGFIRKTASDKELLLVGRIAIIAVSVIGLFLAYDSANKSLLDMIAKAWGGFGAAFGPVMLLSLFWSRMNHWGALSGLLTGAVVFVVWTYYTGGVLDIFGVVPGFIAATLVAVIVSVLTALPKQDVILAFTEMQRRLGVGIVNAAPVREKPKVDSPLDRISP